MCDITNYENLANAIILQAVNDYRKASKNLNSKQNLAEIRSIERFFRSKWYGILTGLDGEVLIKKLREECL